MYRYYENYMRACALCAIIQEIMSIDNIIRIYICVDIWYIIAVQNI